jgi:hypothetical protein
MMARHHGKHKKSDGYKVGERDHMGLRAHEGHRMGHRMHNSARALYKTDTGMIHEDPTAACLLPHNVIEKEWEYSGSPLGGEIGSLFTGENRMMRKDAMDRDKITHPGKY